MVLEGGVCGIWRLGVDRVEEAIERDLGVHRDRSASRETDNEVGADCRIVGLPAHVGLGVEVDVMGETRALHDIAKRDLPPLTTDPGTAECLREPARILGDLRLRLHDRVELAAEVARPVALVSRELINCGAQLAQGAAVHGWSSVSGQTTGENQDQRNECCAADECQKDVHRVSLSGAPGFGKGPCR